MKLQFHEHPQIVLRGATRSARGIRAQALATALATRGSQVASVVAIGSLVVGLLTNPAAGDGPSPIESAVAALDSDHDAAASAVHVLRGGGAEAAAALEAGWTRLSPLAHKRALHALAALAPDHPAAVRTLAVAARASDPSLANAALDALGDSGGPGREALVALLSEQPVGNRAAATLAAADPDAAVGPLLHAIDREGGSERPALRDALARAVTRATRPAPALRGWLRTAPSAPALGSASLALAACRTETATLTAFIERAIGDETDFDTTWRLLQAARSAGPSASLDAWIVRQAQESDAWMLRGAAVEAMGARFPTRDEVRRAIGDPYPRVRVAAVDLLAADSPTTLERARLARKDPWPMVRAASVRSLSEEDETTPVLVAAVDDSMSVVRAAAIETLALRRHDEGWERIHARLRAAGEWPNVTEAAIGYSRTHCRRDATDALIRVVLRAGRGQAQVDELNNAALAIEALRVLGTPDARAFLEQLADTPGVPPTLKLALERPLPSGARCDPLP